MRKSFELKIYELDGTYVGTMPVSDRISDISYSYQINGGQGTFDIELDLFWNDSKYSEGNFVRAYVYDENNPSGSVIFTGQVNRIERTYSYGVEKVRLGCLGLGTLLSSVIFKSSGLYSFDISATAGSVVKSVVDYFNTVRSGNWISYVASEVETGPNVNVRFEYASCLDAVKKCSDVSGFDWIIEPDGRLRFFSVPSVSHFPTLQKDVQSVVANEDSENCVNRYFFTYSGGTVTAEDIPSQSILGIREKAESDTSVLDAGTATTKANAYIALNKNPRKKISLVLNGNYSFKDLEIWDDSLTWDDSGTWQEIGIVAGIEHIRPGDVLSIRNSLYAVDNLKIVRLAYNPEEIKIDLEDYDSFGKEIIS